MKQEASVRHSKLILYILLNLSKSSLVVAAYSKIKRPNWFGESSAAALPAHVS
jgi:hypothetical protein